MGEDYRGDTLRMRHEDSETICSIWDDFAPADIRAKCEEWIEQGDWHNEDGDGCEVSVDWVVTDEDGEEADSGTVTVQIEHNERVKVKQAGGSPDCDHDWERDERVGCRENPGVMGHGGTKVSVTDICSECGIKRSTMHNGSQRNPGQPETEVSYYFAEVS
jgi:hypothetical protein